MASQTMPMHPFFPGQIPAFYHQPGQVNVPIAAHQISGGLQPAVVPNNPVKPPNKIEIQNSTVSDTKIPDNVTIVETP